MENIGKVNYWYDDRMWMRCGACGTAFDMDLVYTRKYPEYGWPDGCVPYCPECGAKKTGWANVSWDEYCKEARNKDG